MAIFLDEAQVAELLDMESCIAALEEAFKEKALGTAANQPRRRLPFQGRRFHLMSASLQASGYAGFKAYGAGKGQDLRERFASNINLTGKAAQVQTCVGRSDEMLVRLITQGVRADFVYVDGSHQAADVLSDAVLAWKLLKPGGLLVFDDYLWPLYQDRPLMNPKMAIDAFVNCHLDQIRYVHVPQMSQFCLVKRDMKAVT